VADRSFERVDYSRLCLPPMRSTGGRAGNVMETTGCNQAKNRRLPKLPKKGLIKPIAQLDEVR
jgi:hypothetical protein